MKNCAKNSAQEKRVELFYSTFSRKEVNDSALKFKIGGILFIRMIYCSVNDTGMLGKGNPRIQVLLTGIKPMTFQYYLTNVIPGTSLGTLPMSYGRLVEARPLN